MKALSRLDEPDPALLRGAQEGDRESLEALLEEVSPRVRQWAMARTGDPDHAADLAQEVLTLLLRKLPTYRGESRFTTWLFAVTRNRALERHRREGRHRMKLERVAAHRDSNRSVAPVDAADLDGKRLKEIVGGFLTRLPDRQREVFQLADLQGLSSPEIGRILGLESSSVRVTLLKARRAVRSHILEHHPEIVEEYLR